MKFLTLIAAASAVRISQKTTNKVTVKGPAQDAEQAIESCDKSGNGELTKKEVFDCFKDHVPPEHHEAVKDFINQIWPHVDTNGNGEVSAQEIEAFIRQTQGSLAQVKGGPSAADVIGACDANGNGELSKKEAHDCIDARVPEQHQEQAHEMVDQVWPMVDTDGSGEISEKELAAAMKAHGPPSLAKKGGPTPADIIAACDANGSGGIDKEEAHACIDAHITDPDQNAQAHDMVDAGFEHVDKNGDGEIDEKELSKAMREHQKGQKLMQTLQGPPSPAEIMEECDKNGNGKLSKGEVKKCIKKHVPEEYRDHVDEAVDAVWPHVDTDGSGEVDMKELETAMKNM